MVDLLFFGGNSIPLHKTEDRLELNMKIGRLLSQNNSLFSKIYLIAFFDFQSQFFPDYNLYDHDNKRNYSSNFMSPGYIVNGFGIDIKNEKVGFSLAATPLASKETIITDKNVNKSRYNLDQDKDIDYSLGAYLRLNIDKEIFDKTNLKLKSIAFYDYKQKTNVDLSLLFEIEYQALKFLKLFTSIQAINDRDMNINLYKDLDNDGESDDFAGVGNRLQLYAQFGIGINFNF